MLIDKIQQDLAAAQKARDQIKVGTLRFLLGDIFNLQIAKYPPAKGGSLTDDDVISVIKKQVKTHRESIEMFSKGSRDDLVSREKAELEILLTYLPPEISEEEIKTKLQEIKVRLPEAEFGVLMKQAMTEFKGQADGAVVSRLLKEI